MSTTADITNIIYMGREIEKIMYMGREVRLAPYVMPSLVGSKKLKDGTMEAGFFGEVTQQELIDAKTLVKMCFVHSKISSHIVFNENVTWLKFAYQNKIEYIARQPLCNYVSLTQYIDDSVVDGSKLIEINNIKYRVRLIKGKTEGQQDDTTSDAGAINHYSEWNRLILPLIKDKNESNYKYPQNVEPDKLKWTERYLEDDFSFSSDKLRFKKLSGAVCQEGITSTITPYSVALVRGGDSIESSSTMRSGKIAQTVGWRPVLEVVDF